MSREASTRAAVLLLGTLALVLAFAASYVGALHKPTPHHIPVAIVASAPAAALLAQSLDSLPGQPLQTRLVASPAAGLAAIADRGVFASYAASAATCHTSFANSSCPPPPPGRLVVASAAGKLVATLLPAIFASANHGARLVVSDAKPLPADDPAGTAGFYAVLAWMVGGYLAATVLGLAGDPRPRDRRDAALRLGAMAAFAILAGFGGMLVLDQGIGVLGGHFLALASVGALTVLAAGAATTGLQALLGLAGTGLAILVFVVLGNPSSGGPYARPLLPGFWRTIGPWIPTGAAVDAVRNITYFSSHALGGALLVLVAYTLFGGALAVAFSGRRSA